MCTSTSASSKEQILKRSFNPSSSECYRIQSSSEASFCNSQLLMAYLLRSKSSIKASKMQHTTYLWLSSSLYSSKASSISTIYTYHQVTNKLTLHQEWYRTTFKKARALSMRHLSQGSMKLWTIPYRCFHLQALID